MMLGTGVDVGAGLLLLAQELDLVQEAVDLRFRLGFQRGVDFAKAGLAGMILMMTTIRAVERVFCCKGSSM
nr:hypothetical protein CFP56_16881 [Quercus suber]